MNRSALPHDYDVLVIGSGFGGSVTALRLTEKGYRVGVLEAGRRFEDADYPRTSWDARRFLWAPKLGCKGIQRIHLLRNVIILAGAGVGGGSLVYANTLYEPGDAFYHDRQWAHITDWRAELAPYYDQAERMLGVVRNPTMTPSDEVVKQVAEQMGVGHTFRLAPVGVFFGRDGRKEPGVEADDPFFGGAGPRRRGCLEVGECMTGCRHNAKNTLVKNYLYLAERAGAAVYPETTAVTVRPLDHDGYAVDTVRTGAWRAGRTARTFTAEQVVFAAGTWGTQQLLHRMKAAGSLPEISARLGVLTRTNSEALGGALTTMRNRKKHDFTRGVAITSSIHPDEHTHIEPVRYGKGSNAMGLLSTRDDRRRRARAALGEVARAGRAPSGAARVTLLRHQPLVRAGRDRAHDADAGQLDHGSSQAHLAWPDQADLGAGARRSEPDLDSRGQRDNAPHRGQDRRFSAEQHR